MKRNRPLNQEKRNAIIKAAIEEFYTRGYEASSMDTISKEANVSKATVYNHFKNKEDLFLALAHILLEKLEKSFQYEYDNNKTIEFQLKEIAYKELEFLNDNENMKLIQILTVVMIQKNEIGLKLLAYERDDCMDMTSKWFEKAKENKKLDFESSLFVSKQFIGMIKSFAFYPQIYGAAKLTSDEQNNLVEKAVQMIIKQYS
ncbi:TetR/AcrR family transcriptional regulator [Aliarcobacter vitoriensis]|uniref:TetR family transcriptional regulator n=1 Tax=Aliarcobacter vitoriensis TaxID=2011099 RepID=A0A366MSV2_9BACT|nr:TetR/AcrR family transcriptional regulator [Aliarcobacter vitoriensis]RBQ28943.1 TetR family transcriptional regulator [Aliarcobacter vitoriensis]